MMHMMSVNSECKYNYYLNIIITSHTVRDNISILYNSLDTVFAGC